MKLYGFANFIEQHHVPCEYSSTVVWQYFVVNKFLWAIKSMKIFYTKNCKHE